MLPEKYMSGKFQLSRHQATPGFRLMLTVTRWDITSTDRGTVFVSAAGARFGKDPTSNLVSDSGSTIPAPGSWQSNYGAQIGLLFSSFYYYYARNGIAYTITTSPCPAGSFCPMNSAAGVNCPEGFYCPTGSPSAIACQPGTYQPSAGKAFCLPCAMVRGFFCIFPLPQPASENRPFPPHRLPQKRAHTFPRAG